MQIVVETGGTVRSIYDEAIDLRSLGAVVIVRASHVEPDGGGNWFADLSPVGGPRLGPFHRRSDALAAEVQWLKQNWLADGE